MLEILTDKLIRNRITTHFSRFQKKHPIGSKSLLGELLRLNGRRARQLITEELSKNYNSQYREKKPENELLGYGFLSRHRESGRSLKTNIDVLKSFLDTPGTERTKFNNKQIGKALYSGVLSYRAWREIALKFDDDSAAMLQLIHKWCIKCEPTRDELVKRRADEILAWQRLIDARLERDRNRPATKTTERIPKERDFPWSILPFRDRRGHPKGRR